MVGGVTIMTSRVDETKKRNQHNPAFGTLEHLCNEPSGWLRTSHLSFRDFIKKNIQGQAGSPGSRENYFPDANGFARAGVTEMPGKNSRLMKR